MKRVKLIMMMTALFLLAGVVVSAQNRAPVPQQTGKGSAFGIYTLLTEVAKNENDDEVHQRYASKIKENKGLTNWLFIDVAFPVLTPSARDPWDIWVDDLEVRLEIIGYSRSKNGNVPVALAFTQPLNAVIADNKTHHVRFFVPPHVLYRYLAPTRNKNEVRKRAAQLHILATVLWRGNPISYITPTGKNAPSKRAIVENMRKLREHRGNYLDNMILPADYTPWAGRSVDRFESMKINMQQRRR